MKIDYEYINKYAKIYRAGSIVPRHVIDLEPIYKKKSQAKKFRHKVTFGCDVYILKNDGYNYIFPVAESDDNVMIYIRAHIKDMYIKGCKYGRGNFFIGEGGLDTINQYISTPDKKMDRYYIGNGTVTKE